MGMTDETESPTGKVIQEYVRAKRAILGTDAKADDIGDRLDRTLRSRIDVLGSDGEQLLAVASDLVVQRLEELERQAVLEDQGMLEKAERPAPRTWTRRKQNPSPGVRTRAPQFGSRRQVR
jgi:hypothetical protein